MVDRILDILRGLSEDTYTTATELAERLHVSSRTIKNDIIALNEITRIIERKVHDFHFEISDYSINNLAMHISVALMRLREGHMLSVDPAAEEQLTTSPDTDLLLAIIDEIEGKYDVIFSRGELVYLLLQLSGKKIITSCHSRENTVISDEIYQIVTDMLTAVEKTFHIDFRYDLELVTTLALHLVPLRIRMKHDISIKNVLAEEVRQHIILAYNMATVACGILEKRSGQKLSYDEVSFIALHFSVAIERKHNKQKENVLIVCGSGKASSELLAYQVRENFGNFLNVVGATSRHELEYYDFHGVDYILTTVPIRISVPVPIIETSTFFKGKEIRKVSKVISDTYVHKFLRYFQEDMIFWSEESDKVQVLKKMCAEAVSKRNLPEDFYDYVMQREEIGRTSFGNLVSIAHPIHPVGEESFVALSILKKPINWDNEEAQLIFLISMKSGGEKGMHGFFNGVSKLVSHRHFVTMLIKTENYREVMDVLKTVAASGD